MMVSFSILMTTVLFLGYLLSKKMGVLLLLVFFLSIVMAEQFKSTKLTNFDRNKLTEMERIEQLRRMNEYPPFAYRLANILEARQELITYFKLERNFVDIFDLDLLFGDIKMFVVLPFFLIGLLELIKLFPLGTGLLTIPPIILLTIAGHDNLYGPICLYPLICSAIVFGLITPLKKILK